MIRPKSSKPIQRHQGKSLTGLFRRLWRIQCCSEHCSTGTERWGEDTVVSSGSVGNLILELEEENLVENSRFQRSSWLFDSSLCAVVPVFVWFGGGQTGLPRMRLFVGEQRSWLPLRFPAVLERVVVEINPFLSAKLKRSVEESGSKPPVWIPAQFEAQLILPGGEGKRVPVCRMTSCPEAKTKNNV